MNLKKQIIIIINIIMGRGKHIIVIINVVIITIVSIKIF